MECLYLVQCAGSEFVYSNNLKDKKVIYLTYKVKHKGIIYLPNSTWTEGRNRLLKEAQSLDKIYDYYIFMDDDIDFSKGDFKTFEKLLERFKPKIAAPQLLGYPAKKISCNVQSVFMFDACMNAFSFDVIFDQKIFPYVSNFDRISWWYSQYILIYLSGYFYRNKVMQFNDVIIANKVHTKYPRNCYIDSTAVKKLKLGASLNDVYFESVERWIVNNIILKEQAWDDYVRLKKTSLINKIY